MNPFQHGEVYVLDDGAETDLDLGHYERFTSTQPLAAQQPHQRPGLPDRAQRRSASGDYLGKTVQVIPHVTDEIKERIRKVAREMAGDIIITEIGGTDGRHRGPAVPRGHPPVRARRSGRRTCSSSTSRSCLYIKAAGELKTKPTQQSIAKLREIGISPGILLCRTETAARPGRAGEDLPLLQRAARGRHRGARREAHHLRGAAHAPRGAARRPRLQAARTSTPRSPT